MRSSSLQVWRLLLWLNILIRTMRTARIELLSKLMKTFLKYLSCRKLLFILNNLYNVKILRMPVIVARFPIIILEISCFFPAKTSKVLCNHLRTFCSLKLNNDPRNFFLFCHAKNPATSQEILR